MDTKQVILELRTQKGMSQDELAEKVYVILIVLPTVQLPPPDMLNDADAP